MTTPFPHNAGRPVPTEADIEALFGKPNAHVQIKQAFAITQEQIEQLHQCTNQEETIALLKGWGYGIFDA